MKKFIKKKLKSLLSFVELFFRIKVDNKSPVDVYYENLSQDCYKFFEQDMKKSSVFIPKQPMVSCASCRGQRRLRAL